MSDDNDLVGVLWAIAHSLDLMKARLDEMHVPTQRVVPPYTPPISGPAVRTWNDSVALSDGWSNRP